MAQSIRQIYDQIVTEKATLSSLDGLLTDPNDGTSKLDSSQKLLTDLKSTSKVAVWRLMFWVVAVVMHFQQRLWDVFSAEVDQRINSASLMTDPWLQQQALKFQYGHDLVWDGNRYVYLVDDPASRIIKKAAVVSPDAIIRVKVKKANNELLSSLEVTAFQAYMDKIKPPGRTILVVNLPDDLLRLQIEVFYNALCDRATVRAAIEAAINRYLNELLEFNGRFIKEKLQDEIQKIPGVKLVKINHCQVKSTTDPSWQEVDLEYPTVAGTLIVDPVYPLGGYYDSPINSTPVIKITPYV